MQFGLFIKVHEFFQRELPLEEGRFLLESHDFLTVQCLQGVRRIKKIPGKHSNDRQLANGRIKHLHPTVILSDIHDRLSVLHDVVVRLENGLGSLSSHGAKRIPLGVFELILGRKINDAICLDLAEQILLGGIRKNIHRLFEL